MRTRTIKGSTRHTADGPGVACRRPGRRALRGGTLVGLVAVAVGALVATSTPAFANENVTIGSSGSPVRDCYHPSQSYPSTNCTYLATLEGGLGVRLVCQYVGQNFIGYGVWDYVLYPATVNRGASQGYTYDYNVNNPGATAPPYRDSRIPICTW